ncbi:MAG: Lrp/AsnC family transcriptional regulator, partial [Nitrososphaerota archaeon]|nr:Lrp/AsnC family transcriptional regulator [Nitrososphaerota archaeon]
LDKYAVLHLFHRGEGDLKRELELVKEVCGDFTVVRTLQARCQTSVRSLNVFDLRILDLLRSDPFMKITSIAEMLGCSRRRVRNRLKTLASLKIFQIEPVINTGAITGSLVAIIAAIFNESDRARIDARLDSLLNDRCFQLYRNVVGSSTYFCTFESNQELTSLHEVLSKSGLVKEVGVAYSSETLDNTLAIPIM